MTSNLSMLVANPKRMQNTGQSNLSVKMLLDEVSPQYLQFFKIREIGKFGWNHSREILPLEKSAFKNPIQQNHKIYPKTPTRKET